MRFFFRRVQAIVVHSIDGVARDLDRVAALDREDSTRSLDVDHDVVREQRIIGHAPEHADIRVDEIADHHQALKVFLLEPNISHDITA